MIWLIALSVAAAVYSGLLGICSAIAGDRSSAVMLLAFAAALSGGAKYIELTL